MRAAIYARYSTDNQREESIEDQIEVCRRYAAQAGFEVAAPSTTVPSRAPTAIVSL
jgi:DNA invertase Pin-like site-specific DNA recombinase